MKKYIIVAPKLSISNGVKALYFLADKLQEKGYEAYMYAPNVTADDKHKYISKITNEMRENYVVVYPEIISGNPLKFKNVVRWVLFYPGRIGGDKVYDDYELIFTWDKIYYKDCDILHFPLLDKSIFYYDGTEKDIDCYFVYKGGKWRECEEFKSMTEINMTYPETREELANLLRRTKTLYSYDRNSSLLNEAVRCNCIVKLVEKDGFSDYIDGYDEAAKNSEEQLKNFIEKTQKMNYTGKIRGGKFIIPIRNRLKIFYNKYIRKNSVKVEDYKYRLW